MRTPSRGSGKGDPEITALVLGVGGNVSQGVLKALALSDLRVRVVAACVSPNSAGLYGADAAVISPFADDPAFPDWLFEICDREGVGVVLSGVEPVLEAVSPLAERLVEQAGATAIVSPPAALEVGADKLLTARWLEEGGFPFARAAAADDAAAVEDLVASCGFPLLAKPRRGKGSQGITTVNSEADLECALTESDYMLQELVGDPNAEFTAACLVDTDGRVRGSIAMRRELVSGTTSVAEAGEFPEVRATAERIATALRPVGPLNVQLRMRGSEAVCFELNVRFSGTAGIRAQFGFNDVEAAIRHLALGEPAADLPVIREGIALRYWSELYPDPKVVRSLIEQGQAGPQPDGRGFLERYRDFPQ
jgi:carbamoyl-phosphate synthase large subunit